MLRYKAFAQNATYISYRDKSIEKQLGYNLEDYVKTKSMLRLQLNGNARHDDSVLNDFQLEIQKIKKIQNPNKGIHLKFGKKTAFENVIRSFQICKIEDCATYAPDGYDFWVFPYHKKIKLKESISCGKF
ncbi:hypothetical protein [Flavobacterium foetidum]|uniref:hypothetical protein n=1 Tax=Flavobacterium foetidum TaxID=2026681 RepID=UPI0010753A6D|nr:hypothetical protein [Flavobacterium foetidum]KAF2516457.1 hypothetical protein E0W73_05030 [Flavobacterium foetidum]